MRRTESLGPIFDSQSSKPSWNQGPELTLRWAPCQGHLRHGECRRSCEDLGVRHQTQRLQDDRFPPTTKGKSQKQKSRAWRGVLERRPCCSPWEERQMELLTETYLILQPGRPRQCPSPSMCLWSLNCRFLSWGQGHWVSRWEVKWPPFTSQMPQGGRPLGTRYPTLALHMPVRGPPQAKEVERFPQERSEWDAVPVSSPSTDERIETRNYMPCSI